MPLLVEALDCDNWVPCYIFDDRSIRAALNDIAGWTVLHPITLDILDVRIRRIHPTTTAAYNRAICDYWKGFSYVSR